MRSLDAELADYLGRVQEAPNVARPLESRRPNFQKKVFHLRRGLREQIHFAESLGGGSEAAAVCCIPLRCLNAQRNARLEVVVGMGTWCGWYAH